MAKRKAYKDGYGIGVEMSDGYGISDKLQRKINDKARTLDRKSKRSNKREVLIINYLQKINVYV